MKKKCLGPEGLVSPEIQKYKDLRGDGLSPQLLQLWGKLLFLATCQQKIGTLPKVRQKNSPYRSRLILSTGRLESLQPFKMCPSVRLSVCHN